MFKCNKPWNNENTLMKLNENKWFKMSIKAIACEIQKLWKNLRLIKEIVKIQ